MMKQNSVHFPSQNAIFPVEFYDFYASAGVWPTDGIEISDEGAAKFNGGNEPSGKMVSMVDGALCWVDRPESVLILEKLIEQAEHQKQSLIASTQQSISLLMGRTLTATESAKVNATLDYIDTVDGVNTSTVSNIDWPFQPQ
ncbi:tail fiber assembly protein [Kluyvera sp. 142486]|uniref:tail fiber assembly protein n=1 Tax=Kluyvera sp. 142486 TaxID=3390050 RepID=UPI0039803A41